jgi:hypothetical protein
MIHGKVMRQYRAALIVSAALLVVVVAWAAAPSTAGAACESGDFCIWQDANRGGGLYHFDGNDANLHNDRFFNRGETVGDNATTVKNNGIPRGLVDVLAYQHTRWRGPALCVPLGAEVSNLKVKGLPRDRDRGDSVSSDEPDRRWNDDISSYRWVANCG